MSGLDDERLNEIDSHWLVQCPACDAGMSMSCKCPAGDPRNAIDWLVTELRAVTADRDREAERADKAEQLLTKVACLGDPAPAQDWHTDAAMKAGQQ